MAQVGAAIALALAMPGAATAAERLTSHLSTKSSASAPAGAAGLCSRYDWACARAPGASAFTEDQLRTAQAVNRKINASVRQINDIDQYRREEVWTLPTARGGDCEDLALLKKAELIRHGISPDRLLLATVLDKRRGSHAVLVLRTDKGDYVLDSLTSRVLHWSKTGYSFIRMQDPRAPERWNSVFAGGIFRR